MCFIICRYHNIQPFCDFFKYLYQPCSLKKKSLQQKIKTKKWIETVKLLKAQKILHLSQSHIFMCLRFLLGFREVELLIKNLNCTIILDNDTFKNKFICFSAEVKIKEQKLSLIFLQFASSVIFNIPQSFFSNMSHSQRRQQC